jgi:hypothetical protein
VLAYPDYANLARAGLPYRDFYFPYPHLYALFIMGVSFFQPNADIFRIFFMFCDIGVLLLLFSTVKLKLGTENALKGAIAYAFFPISIIEAGWNGHFEPLVILVMLASFYLFFKRRSYLSGIALGLATALKIFPVFILPVLLIFQKTFRDRGKLLFGFLLAFFVSSIPFLIWAPSEFFSYYSGVAISLHRPSASPIYVNSFTAYAQQYISPNIVTNILLFGIIASYVYAYVEKKGFLNKCNRFFLALIGLLFITWGLLKVGYPFSKLYISYYWWAPPEIFYITGGLTVFGGILLSYHVAKESISQKITEELQSIIIWAIIALFLGVLSARTFYGWYLLFFSPLLLSFMLLPGRHHQRGGKVENTYLKKPCSKIALIMIFLTMVSYPAYYETNFRSLGIDKNYLFKDEMDSTRGWVLAPRVGPNESKIGWEDNALIGWTPYQGSISVNDENVITLTTKEEFDYSFYRSPEINVNILDFPFLLIKANPQGSVFKKIHYRYSDNTEGYYTIDSKANEWKTFLIYVKPSPSSSIVNQITIVIENFDSSRSVLINSVKFVASGDYGLRTENGIADFWLKGEVDKSVMDEFVSMEKDVNFAVNPMSYFVIRFKSDINPTFGHHFTIRVTVDGVTSDNKKVRWVDLVPFLPFLSKEYWTTYRTNIKKVEEIYRIELISIEKIIVSIIDYTDCNEEHHFYIDYLGFVDEPLLDTRIVLASLGCIAFCGTAIVVLLHKLSPPRRGSGPLRRVPEGRT